MCYDVTKSPWENPTCPRIWTRWIKWIMIIQITSHLVAELDCQDLANEVVQAQDKHPKGYDKGNGVKMPWLPRWDICTTFANVNIHEISQSWGAWWLALFFLDCHLFVILKRPFKGFWGSRGSSTLRESIQDREFPSVRNLLEVGVQNESHTCLIANTPERKLRQRDLKNITLKHQKESCFRSSGLPPLPTYSRCTYPHVLHDLRGVPLCHHIKRNLQNNTMIRISRVILSLLHLSISLFHPFPRLQYWYNFLIPRLLNPWILVRWVSQNQARKKPQWLTALQHEMPWWSQYFVSLA